MPNPTVRPGYSTVMPYIWLKIYGEKYAEWAMHRLRNLNLYPSLFFMDQIRLTASYCSSLWHGIKLEVISQCIGVKGESTEARRNRIRQLKISLTYQNLGTPDDLVEFREQQKGFQARL